MDLYEILCQCRPVLEHARHLETALGGVYENYHSTESQYGYRPSDATPGDASGAAAVLMEELLTPQFLDAVENNPARNPDFDDIRGDPGDGDWLFFAIERLLSVAREVRGIVSFGVSVEKRLSDQSAAAHRAAESLEEALHKLRARPEVMNRLLWPKRDASAERTPEDSEDTPEQTASRNAIMIDKYQKDPESIAWGIRKWAVFLDCSTSTVQSLPAWKQVLALRAMMQAESALRRNN